jgi:hypothetical protein
MELTGFKGNAIIAVVDNRVLNHYVIASVDIPSVGVCCATCRSRDGTDVNVVEHDILAFVNLDIHR